MYMGLPEVVFTIQVLVPKFKFLKELKAEIVEVEVTELNVKLGALDTPPPAILPKLNVAVALWFLTKPPVPVNVKPVAFPILSTVAPAVLEFKTILAAPKVIDLVEVYKL